MYLHSKYCLILTLSEELFGAKSWICKLLGVCDTGHKHSHVFGTPTHTDSTIRWTMIRVTDFIRLRSSFVGRHYAVLFTAIKFLHSSFRARIITHNIIKIIPIIIIIISIYVIQYFIFVYSEHHWQFKIVFIFTVH